MNFKKLTSISFLTLAFIPMFAFAEISIMNNTNGYGTAKTDTSPCSSIHEDGIIKPHAKLPIPQVIADVYCGFGCAIDLYMTKDCSGRRVATINIDFFQKISGIKNYGVDGYRVSGTGQTATIDGGPSY